MNPELEKHVLLGVLELMSDRINKRSPRSKFLNVVAAIAGFLAIHYGFGIYKDLPGSQTFAVLAGAAVGAVLAFWVAVGFFDEWITVILKVVDRDLIQDRLRELGA